MTLGLDQLTDDQLVELAREVGGEINRRQPAVADAAKQAIFEEIERVRASVSGLWARRKAIALMVKAAFGDGWSLKIWRSDNGQKLRVYIESSQMPYWRLTYHETGDRDNPPGTVSAWSRRTEDPEPDHRLVKYIAEAAIEASPEGDFIPCDRAAAAEGDVNLPLDFVDLLDLCQRDARRAKVEQQAREKLFAAYHKEVSRLAFTMPRPKDADDRLAAMRAEAEEELAQHMRAYDLEEQIR